MGRKLRLSLRHLWCRRRWDLPNLEVLRILEGSIRKFAMKRLLKIFAFVIPGTFAQQLQPVAGSISGNLRGDDGSAIAGGIIILHREPTEKSRMARQRTDWSTVTAATGVF